MAIQKEGKEKNKTGIYCPAMDAQATVYVGMEQRPTQSVLEGLCI